MGIKRFGRLVGRLIVAAIGLWSLTFVAVLAVAYPRTQPPLPERADAIVCLGAGMSETRGWHVPDSASLRRADTCVDLYEAGVAPVIVFTGYGHEISSAAAAMGSVATARDVPQDAILLEERARSTIQNAAFSLPLVGEEATHIVVVSDAFHLPRARGIFDLLSDAAISTYPVDARLHPQPDAGERSTLMFSIREATAIWVNLARAAAYWGAGLLGIPEDTRIAWFN